jgi:ComF family protein
MHEEAVFSSSEDRIRADQVTIAVARPSVVSSGTCPGLGRTWARLSLQSIFSVLFPSDCRICGLPLLNVSRLPVCPECLAGIHPASGKVCSICGERVLSSYSEKDEDGWRRCPVCRRVERPFERAVAYGSYEGALREMVHLLKYNGVRPAAKVLGRMLAESVAELVPELAQETVLVIPVPLFQGKLRQREFNQAELIARAALQRLGMRFHLAPDILRRTRDTDSQTGLTGHQRRENLRGAFAVVRAQEVIGRELLLVDDVYTTGTTATECARVLRKAGASKIWVATVARTLKLASKYAEASGEDSVETGFKVSKFQVEAESETAGALARDTLKH